MVDYKIVHKFKKSKQFKNVRLDGHMLNFTYKDTQFTLFFPDVFRYKTKYYELTAPDSKKHFHYRNLHTFKTTKEITITSVKYFADQYLWRVLRYGY